MITKQDIDKILGQVNVILDRLDKRLTALEEASKTTKTATPRKSSSSS